jgi:hypothetical protein
MGYSFFIFQFLCDLHRLNSLTAIIIVYISSNLNVRRRSRHRHRHRRRRRQHFRRRHRHLQRIKPLKDTET